MMLFCSESLATLATGSQPATDNYLEMTKNNARLSNRNPNLTESETTDRGDNSANSVGIENSNVSSRTHSTVSRDQSPESSVSRNSATELIVSTDQNRTQATEKDEEAYTEDENHDNTQQVFADAADQRSYKKKTAENSEAEQTDEERGDIKPENSWPESTVSEDERRLENTKHEIDQHDVSLDSKLADSQNAKKDSTDVHDKKNEGQSMTAKPAAIKANHSHTSKPKEDFSHNKKEKVQSKRRKARPKSLDSQLNNSQSEEKPKSLRRFRSSPRLLPRRKANADCVSNTLTSRRGFLSRIHYSLIDTPYIQIPLKNIYNQQVKINKPATQLFITSIRLIRAIYKCISGLLGWAAAAHFARLSFNAKKECMYVGGHRVEYDILRFLCLYT